MTRLLLIENSDDPAVALIDQIKTKPYIVDCTSSKEQAMYLLNTASYQLVVLNVSSGIVADNQQGLQFCNEIRMRNEHIPLLFIGHQDAATKIQAFEYGADDVIAQPYLWNEVVARIQALIRRYQEKQIKKLSCSDLTFDPRSREVHRDGQYIQLKKKESLILELMMNNLGKILSRAEIMARVWDRNADPITNVVDVHMHFLRRKVDEGYQQKLIHTVHGFGYRMAAE